MKKIAILMFIISAFMLISCNDDGKGDTEKGYVDPGSWKGKDVNEHKSHNINGENCSGQGCNAIIYNNTLNDISYVGIAIDNFDNSTGTSRLNFKLYWESSTIPEGSITLTSSQYNARLVANGNEHSTTDGNYITMTINFNTKDGTYDINITSGIVFTDEEGNPTFTLPVNTEIRAVKHP